MPFITEFASFISSDNQENARAAAAKIANAFSEQQLRAVIYYAGTNYDPKTLVDEMTRAFPGVATIGCTTAGEFADGRMLKNSVVAMGVGTDVMDMFEAVGVGGIDKAEDPAKTALAALETKTGLKMRDLDFHKYAGWLLLDGLAAKNDELVERCGELTDIVFAGGCAGDDGHWRQTLVWVNGEIFENGAVFAVMKPKGKFAVLKTQSAKPTGKTMTATRVDAEKRIIREFDGRPAAEAYAEAMGVRIDPESITRDEKTSQEIYRDQLLANGMVKNLHGRMVAKDAFIDMFISWPLALMIDGVPFIRAATTVVEDGGLQVFMPPIEGMRYAVCRAGSVVDETKRVLKEQRRELGGISAVMMAGCLLREIQVRNDDQVGAFEELFADIPVSAFSSYGEIYVSVVSQSASMIVFA